MFVILSVMQDSDLEGHSLTYRQPRGLTILGSGTVASAGLGYWTSPSRMPSSLVWQYLAWASMVGRVAASWVKNPV